MKKNVAFLFFVHFSLSTIYGQVERLVYFVHGLGGTAKAWSPVTTASESGVPGFPARKLKAINSEYTIFNNSVDNAARALQTNYLGANGDDQMAFLGIAPTEANRAKNFIIAHSQGGIVSRQLDRLYTTDALQYPRAFGGLVTFGTPHGGAQIVNNRDAIVAELNLGCGVIGSAELAEISNIGFLGGLFSVGLPQRFIDSICGFLTDRIIPRVFASSIDAGY